jgi:hypothetical protein
MTAIVTGERLRRQISESIEKLRRELAAADPPLRAEDPLVESAARTQGISPERAPVLSAAGGAQ